MIEERCKFILEKYHMGKGSVISILQDVQEEFGYIPEEVVFWFADKLNVPASNFYGVATFYAQFHLKPRGKNLITACCGTACHVKGADAIINRVREDLAIPEGEDTSYDNKFTLEEVACVGACSMAPVIIVNGKVHGAMTADGASRLMKKFEKGKGR